MRRTLHGWLLLFSLALITVSPLGCSDERSTPSQSDSRSVDATADTRSGGNDLQGDTQPADAHSSDQAATSEMGADSGDPDLKSDLGPHPLCATAGGTCTENRWTVCPVGKEPIDPDPHRDCGEGGMGGWCCLDAPPSTCSATQGVNCVVGTTCTGCWFASDPSLTCEAGRVCCLDMCD